MADPRNPLIIGVTNDAGERGVNKLPTSYAVNQLFSGELLAVNKNVDTVIQCGNYRFQASTNNTSNGLPSHMVSVTGILTVLHDRTSIPAGVFGGGEPTGGSPTAIRQIAWPDGPNDITPYTRTKVGSTWGEWVTMGGNLRRVKLTANTTAQTNVMYYSFGGYTLTLPNANSYPLGTQVGLEQWYGKGTVQYQDGQNEPLTLETTPAYQADNTGTPTHTIDGPRVYFFEIVENTNTTPATRTWILDIDNDDTKMHTYLRGQISSEQAARANADTALEGKVNATLGVNIASPYTGTTISQRILNEQSARSTADNTLQSNIDDLRGDVNKTLGVTVANPYSGTTIQQQITNVNTRVGTEETNRAAADTALEGRVNATLGVGIANPYSGTTIKDQIDNEATTRANADNNKDRLHKAYYVNSDITSSYTFPDGNEASKTLTELLKTVNPTITLGANVASVALPAAAAAYNGACINLEIPGTNQVTVTAGTGSSADSEAFTNSTGATLLLPFECVMTGASSYRWNLLVIA